MLACDFLTVETVWLTLAASSTNTKQPHDYHSPPVTEFSNPTPFRLFM